jgi:hypothetical protein
VFARYWWSSLASLFFLFTAHHARAQEEGASSDSTPSSTCESDRARGEAAERGGRFLDARASFSACADARCSTSETCRRDEERIVGLIPSVRFTVTNATPSQRDALRLRIDDGELAPVPIGDVRVDPGFHVIRYRAEVGRVASAFVTVEAGEHARSVELDHNATWDDTPAEAPKKKGCSAAPYVAMGFGAVAALVGTGLLLTIDSAGWQSRTHGDMESVRNFQRSAGWIGVGVGLTSIALGGMWALYDRPCGDPQKK